jgi:hypothetical protein
VGAPAPMSESSQTRSFGDLSSTSGLPPVSGPSHVSFLGLGSAKLRNARHEQMFSGSLQLADIIEPYRHFRVVPEPDSCAAA